MSMIPSSLRRISPLCIGLFAMVLLGVAQAREIPTWSGEGSCVGRLRCKYPDGSGSAFHGVYAGSIEECNADLSAFVGQVRTSTSGSACTLVVSAPCMCSIGVQIGSGGLQSADALVDFTRITANGNSLTFEGVKSADLLEGTLTNDLGLEVGSLIVQVIDDTSHYVDAEIWSNGKRFSAQEIIFADDDLNRVVIAHAGAQTMVVKGIWNLVDEAFLRDPDAPRPSAVPRGARPHR